MLRVFILATTVMAGTAYANDYSPYPELSIKTVAIKYDRGRVEVRVAITNNSSQSYNSNFECSLFDENGTAYASVSGTANAIPPAQTVSTWAAGRESEKPMKASCRITLLLPTT